MFSVKFVRTFYMWGPVYAYMGLIFYFSAQSYPNVGVDISGISDKLLHFFEYSILTLLILRGYGELALPYFSKSAFFSFLYAVSDEIHQYFVPRRSADILDLLADTGGIMAVLFVTYLLASMFFKKEFSK